MSSIFKKRIPPVLLCGQVGFSLIIVIAKLFYSLLYFLCHTDRFSGSDYALCHTNQFSGSDYALCHTNRFSGSDYALCHTNQMNRYPTVTATSVNGAPMRMKSLKLTS
jgi:hypothetical protein